MSEAVLLDTSFLIRLLNRKEKLHENAKGYYQYFLDNNFTLKMSTISVAEYCVRGKSEELPHKQLSIVPFNINHAKQAGMFARILFENKKGLTQKKLPRVIIPNDAKLLAQAQCETNILYYITADSRSEKLFQTLQKEHTVNFKFIDIHTPRKEQIGDKTLFD